MATVEYQPLIPARVARESHRKVKEKRYRPSIRAIEAFAVFVVCLAVYMVLGWKVVHEQHLIIFDATARLAHAYFVLWNQPGKLASIGFVWAPFSTLAFLPFALIKPLATSMMALTATSATFAALTMMVLNRACGYLGMPVWQRLPLVALLAFNPMTLFYAVNGMSEMPYLFLLSAAVYYFIRWHVEEKSVWLVPVGMILSIAVLTRYEILGYALVICAAIPVILWVQRKRRQEVSASTITVLVPIIYALVLWVFFNWLIIGDPLFWLKNQIGIGGGGGETAATASKNVVSDAVNAALPTFNDLFRRLLELNVKMFPLVLIVAGALLLWTLAAALGPRTRESTRNGVMSFWMAVLVATNLLTTTALLVKGLDTNLLQLRYNMRSMPVAILGVAWLWYTVPGGRWPRLAVWATAIVILVATIPSTWHVMSTWPVQYEENIFVRALSTGADQEGTDPGGPYTIGNADDREMSNWIKANLPVARDRILTDDGQTFGVMLVSGHPEWFRDRIDYGDGNWKRVLRKPWGKVDYLLVARYPLPPDDIVDEIEKRYPGLRTNSVPGISVVHSNAHYVLLRVAPRKPGTTPSRFDKAFDGAIPQGLTPRL